MKNYEWFALYEQEGSAASFNYKTRLLGKKFWIQKVLLQYSFANILYMQIYNLKTLKFLWVLLVDPQKDHIFAFKNTIIMFCQIKTNLILFIY